jgi:hypothetical protein
VKIILLFLAMALTTTGAAQAKPRYATPLQAGTALFQQSHKPLAKIGDAAVEIVCRGVKKGKFVAGSGPVKSNEFGCVALIETVKTKATTCVLLTLKMTRGVTPAVLGETTLPRKDCGVTPAKPKPKSKLAQAFSA